MNTFFKYNAIITRVVDGDTFDLRCGVGFGITMQQRFRLTCIDTPETWRPKTDAEALHGEKATAMAERLLNLFPYFYIRSSAKSVVYGRYEAKVTLLDGRDLADTLLEAGMGKLALYKDEE